MKLFKYLWLLPLSIIVSTVVAAPSQLDSTTVVDPDRRIKLVLPADERHLVLKEMRTFVIALHDITNGIATDDMDAVAKAARSMGSSAAGEVPPQVVAKLPATFKQLAGKVHSTFDMIAMDAEDIGDGMHTIEQLSALTKHCIACHAIYQVEKKQ